MKIFAQFPIILLAAAMFVGTTANAQSNKDKTRFNYVAKGLKLDAATKAKLQPTFFEYLNEIKMAKKPYSTLKDQHAAAIESDKLSEEQAAKLITTHWASEEAELKTMRKYTPLFVSILGQRRTYNLFRLANDKIK